MGSNLLELCLFIENDQLQNGTWRKYCIRSTLESYFVARSWRRIASVFFFFFQLIFRPCHQRPTPMSNTYPIHSIPKPMEHFSKVTLWTQPQWIQWIDQHIRGRNFIITSPKTDASTQSSTMALKWIINNEVFFYFAQHVFSLSFCR